MHRAHTRSSRRARQWCARSIIPYYTIRFRAGRTYNSCQPDLFCRMQSEVLACLRRNAGAMHSALVSAIVSSTERRLSLNCEWFTDDVPNCAFAETFCELVNFAIFRVISLEELNCGVLLLVDSVCHFRVSKWTLYGEKRRNRLLKFIIGLVKNLEKKKFCGVNFPNPGHVFEYFKSNRNYIEVKVNLWETKKILEDHKDKLKGSGRRDSNAHEHLCIQNKPQSVHASSVEKGVVRDKDGYSIQLA